jgi:predicted PhzF superfamily epimerase YddE/YHI9
MAQIHPTKPPSVTHILDLGFEGAIGGVMFYYEIPPVQGQDHQTRKFRVRRMTSGGEEDPATGSAACAFGVWMSQNALKSSREGVEGRSFKYEIAQGVEMGRVSFSPILYKTIWSVLTEPLLNRGVKLLLMWI